VTQETIEKHVHRTLGKLRLSETTADHRRVLAFPESRQGGGCG
jgi:hypothetical protein